MSKKHKHGLTLEDVQTIIGRGVLDESFRQAFVQDPEEVVKRLGVSVEDDDNARELLSSIGKVLEGGSDIQAAMDDIRKAYEESSDGVIRPRCA
ncbi:hypothetical protein [Ruegeria sp. R14_0]|uniref:hypothetical protein n=1 Tax=Ruegeria sp. R14_0 TaxID=2821100 RepID=UPI001ADBFE69|nr:hypothetical protein [Ruegeria sp. R14_0]MBO9446757.1 hypothetical protein [Ruegeria sp. R14_0]